MTRPAPAFDARAELFEHEARDDSFHMGEDEERAYWNRQAPPAPYRSETFPQATVIGGPHDGKRIAIARERMILRTSSGVYMRHADRPEYLFHVPSLLATA